MKWQIPSPGVNLSINTKNNKIPYNDFLPVIKDKIYSSWKEYWNTSSAVKDKFYPTPENKVWTIPWFKNLNFFNRDFIVTICRMRLGDCCTPVHLNRLQLKENPLCICGQYGDLNHLIFGYELFSIESSKLYKDFSCIDHQLCLFQL